MVLKQKQKYRSTEQDRKPRNTPMNPWSIYDKGGKNIQRRKNSLFNKNEIVTCKKKNEIRTFTNTIYKTKVKMD